MLNRLVIGAILFFCLLVFSCQSGASSAEEKKLALSTEDIRALAKEAYIYGYPLVDNYRFLYGKSIDKADPMFRVPMNEFFHEADVIKAGQKTVQTPNTETPYSRASLDLRAEPMVLTVPNIEKGRYYSMQLIDLYTHNYAYVGTRSEGNEASSYLLTGPRWHGDLPKGIKKIIPCETDLVTVVGRTQLFGKEDLPKVIQIQKGYKLQPLSAFLGIAAPVFKDTISWLKSLTSADDLRNSLRFFEQLNFVLGFCPTHSSETELMNRLSGIGIGTGKRFDSTQWSAEQQQAFRDGVNDAWKDFAALQQEAGKGSITSADIFGTREELKNNYMYRWAGDVFGIWGNTAYEAIYPGYEVDADGEPLDASKYKYSVRFHPDSMPANAFWSITMYDMPGRALVANALDRYIINKPMLPKLTKDKDGYLTVYMQSKAPDKDKISNWLPTPNGPFYAVMRLYWPKPEALNGSWKQPPLMKQKP
jgi:hypothetical protein